MTITTAEAPKRRTDRMRAVQNLTSYQDHLMVVNPGYN